MTALADLLLALAGLPTLPGARCRNRWELFDRTINAERGAPPGDVEYARQHARDLCAVCPALNGCRAWLDSLPPNQRPLGVVAGRLNPPGRKS